MVVGPRKIFLTLRKILRLECANTKIMDFNLFCSIFFMIRTCYVVFGVILALFLAQNFKNLSFDRANQSTFRMSALSVVYNVAIMESTQPAIELASKHMTKLKNVYILCEINSTHVFMKYFLGPKRFYLQVFDKKVYIVCQN